MKIKFVSSTLVDEGNLYIYTNDWGQNKELQEILSNVISKELKKLARKN